MKKELIKFLDKCNANNELYTVNTEEYVNKLLSKAVMVTHYNERKIVGFCAFYANDLTKSISFLSMICIDNEYRRKGIGGLMLNYWITYTKKQGFENCLLEVKKSNIKAIAIYKKLGFKKIKDLEKSILMNLKHDIKV